MARSPKIIWNEGMFLSPHHFQGLEHYFRDRENALIKTTNPFFWGISQLVVDEEELANGTFALLQCEGMMPDGLPFEIPGSDRTPETRLVGEHFSHTVEKIDVFLGIPVERRDAPNCPLEEGKLHRETRYLSDILSLNDENTGENNQEIRVARTNFKILFSGEPLDNYTTIKIAEIRRNETGLHALNEKYIPPCLAISASKKIMALLRGLLDKLAGLSSNLSQQKRANQYELRASELENILKLQIVNAGLPVLSHCYHQNKVSPEMLYQTLAQFAGALTAFHEQLNPRDIPPYDHANLAATFSKLDLVVNQLIGMSDKEGSIRIPLSKIDESRCQGDIPMELLESAQFFLAVTANVPEMQIQNMLPQVIRMGSPEHIDYLITNALPGIKIVYVSRPHPAIPLKAGCVYFKVETAGDLWESVNKHKKILLYTPPGIPGLSLEMHAVKES